MVILTCFKCQTKNNGKREECSNCGSPTHAGPAPKIVVDPALYAEYHAKCQKKTVKRTGNGAGSSDTNKKLCPMTKGGKQECNYIGMARVSPTESNLKRMEKHCKKFRH
jgi:hypothetical protein